MIRHCNNGMVASQYMQKRLGLGVVDDQARGETFQNKCLSVETSVREKALIKFF